MQDKKQIQAYRAAALEPVKSFSLQGSMPTGLVYDQQLDRLYVAIRNAVLDLDAKTGSELGRVAAPTGTDRLWLDPKSRTLFAVSYGAVAVMHAGDHLTAVDELPIDVKGHAFAFDSETGFLYLPGGREGRSKLLILKQQSGGGQPTATGPGRSEELIRVSGFKVSRLRFRGFNHFNCPAQASTQSDAFRLQVR